MKLKLENISMIKNAEIILDGLTIIAGENDTGKSTVGKLLFAMIKALNRYEEDLQEGKKKALFRQIEKIYLKIRTHYDFENNQPLRKAFFPPIFFRELLVPSDSSGVESLVENKLDILRKSTPENRTENLHSVVTDLEDLKTLFLQAEDKPATVKKALMKAFASEFYLELTPKSFPGLKSFLQLAEGDNKIVTLRLENNRVDTLELHDEVFFEDVTFIESPIFLQMYEVINKADTLFEIGHEENKQRRLRRLSRPTTALHVKDLISKLEGARYFHSDQLLLSASVNNPLLENIARLIDGQFFFDEKNRDFIFSNSRGKIRPVNTASGIKSFGIIQLLIQANFLDDRSLLIIDEPETHLHPKWQIEYAKLMVELVKHHIPVLLSSHSPYLIQALKVFSESNGLAEKTNFYLAEKGEDNLSTIINVNENLNRLFKKLSEPLQELVWQ